MRVAVGARSDVGRVRTGNEDAYLVQAPLFAVADGLGGHIAGEVASATAMELVAERGRQPVAAADLSNLVRDANAAVWDKTQADPALHGMGTTCTLVLIDGATAHIAHVGDSRAYLLRDGMLEQLTQDHTLVARLVSEGRLRPEDAADHPQRSVITRALGIEEDVEVDLVMHQLLVQDRLLLCSDGLTSMVTDESIRRALQDDIDAQAAADRLVDLANESGGEDNITVVVLDIKDEDEVIAEGAPEAAVAQGSGPRPNRTPRWVRRAGIALASLFVVGIALYGMATYALNNLLWFVGVNDEGRVTIFHGLPDTIAGLDLARPEEETDLRAAGLPEFMRADVTEGHKVDSLAEAREYVSNLEERALDFGSTPGPTPSVTQTP